MVILGFPCNQFGHQNWFKGDEIHASLKHVRPGNGYEPNFTLCAKGDVNGAKAWPIFKFLCNALPCPSDGEDVTGPVGVFNNNIVYQTPGWSPLQRNDVSWNFAKFLVGRDGIPYKRFSPKFETKLLADDIAHLCNSSAER